MGKKLSLEVCNKILERLAEGRSLRSICKDKDIPVSDAAVRKAASEGGVFGSQYARARDLGLDAIADALLEISSDSSSDWVKKERKDGSIVFVFNNENVQRSRLSCDVRKWYLSKLAPKR